MSIDCGTSHTIAAMALSKDGGAGVSICWWDNNSSNGPSLVGYGNFQSCNKPMKFKGLNTVKALKVHCGLYHTAAVMETGELFTWYVTRQVVMGRRGVLFFEVSWYTYQ